MQMQSSFTFLLLASVLTTVHSSAYVINADCVGKAGQWIAVDQGCVKCEDVSVKDTKPVVCGHGVGEDREVVAPNSENMVRNGKDKLTCTRSGDGKSLTATMSSIATSPESVTASEADCKVKNGQWINKMQRWNAGIYCGRYASLTYKTEKEARFRPTMCGCGSTDCKSITREWQPWEKGSKDVTVCVVKNNALEPICPNQ